MTESSTIPGVAYFQNLNPASKWSWQILGTYRMLGILSEFGMQVLIGADVIQSKKRSGTSRSMLTQRHGQATP